MFSSEADISSIGKTDVCIIGTGIDEMILGALLVNSGSNVVHLDHSKRYGGSEACLTVHELHFLQKHTSSEEGISESVSDNEGIANKTSIVIHLCDLKKESDTNLQDDVDLNGLPADLELEIYDEPLFREIPRNLSIDMSPRLLFSSSTVVTAMLGLGLSEYITFLSVEGPIVKDHFSQSDPIISATSNKRFPMTRQEIFRSSFNLRDKSRLQKFLTCNALTPNLNIMTPAKFGSEFHDRRPQANEEFSSNSDLTDKSVTRGDASIDFGQLSSEMVRCISHGVCLVPFGSQLTKEVLSQGVASVGFHQEGNIFIIPKYGMSDIVQALARFCAVKGSFQVLGCPISSFNCESLVPDSFRGLLIYSTRDKRLEVEKNECDKCVHNSQEKIIVTTNEGQTLQTDFLIIPKDIHNSIGKTEIYGSPNSSHRKMIAIQTTVFIGTSNFIPESEDIENTEIKETQCVDSGTKCVVHLFKGASVVVIQVKYDSKYFILYIMSLREQIEWKLCEEGNTNNGNKSHKEIEDNNKCENHKEVERLYHQTPPIFSLRYDVSMREDTRTSSPFVFNDSCLRELRGVANRIHDSCEVSKNIAYD